MPKSEIQDFAVLHTINAMKKKIIWATIKLHAHQKGQRSFFHHCRKREFILGMGRWRSAIFSCDVFTWPLIDTQTKGQDQPAQSLKLYFVRHERNWEARLASWNTTSQFISTRWPTGRFLWMSNFCRCCIKVHDLLETQWNFMTHYDDDGETRMFCVCSHEPSKTAIFLIFIIHINSFSCMLRLSRGQMTVLWYWKKGEQWTKL